MVQFTFYIMNQPIQIPKGQKGPYFLIWSVVNFALRGFVFTAECKSFYDSLYHGLRTPNEGISQRYLKNWADLEDKICFGRT